MRLENFLWFYDLELGGIIIGFYHLIIYCLLVVAAVVSFFVAPIYYPETNLILLAVGIIVYVLLSCLLVWLSWQLIMGVEFRDHRRVQRFRILCMFGLVMNILIVIAVLTRIGDYELTGYHITILVVYLIISFSTQVYIFLVIDSLYKKFRDEEFPQSSRR